MVLLRKIHGGLDTEAGFCGGDPGKATCEFVHTGTTGHAESVRVDYDPKGLSFSALLRWFFRMHDPTTQDRQGNDVGTQYRSAIFWTAEEQRVVAERLKAEVDRYGKWGRPLVTEIRQAGP